MTPSPLKRSSHFVPGILNRGFFFLRKSNQRNVKVGTIIANILSVLWKIEKMFSNRQKGAHTSWIADFQSAVENHTALRKKSKVFHIIFYTIWKTDDKYVVFSKCCLFSACHKKSPFRRRGLYCRKADQCVSRCHMIKKTEPTVMAQARSIFQVSISPPSSQPRKMPMTGTTYS